MKFSRHWTLVTSLTAMFAAIACIIVSALGMYLYSAAELALETRADYTLIGRVEHFRTLLHDLYNVEQMEQRPALFESMLGNELDVRIFRRQGDAPFININPAKLTPPVMSAVSVGKALTTDALREGLKADGVRVRWVSALAEVGDHNDTVEIVAAYVMTQETHMMNAYLLRVIGAALLAVCLTTICSFVILKRSLKTLEVMSGQAKDITPVNLSARLAIDRAPTELRNLAMAFNAMLGRLEEGYAHLSQFSADLAHEIRTPVNVLMGQTQVTLGQLRPPEEYEQLLESNLEELTRLSRIIENILFLAHADHAAMVVERERLNLLEELHKIAEYFEGIAEERDMHFEVAASGMGYANSVMWRRAVNNLVINAVRYGQAGSVIILEARQDAQGSYVTVTNSANPMTTVELERMFDRFYRGDRSRSAFTESNGLGLAIVRAIMVLHGGSATVSAQNSQVCFNLQFPNV
jgi:two-component system heavy metal sensor histidine kinase CusS